MGSAAAGPVTARRGAPGRAAWAVLAAWLLAAAPVSAAPPPPIEISGASRVEVDDAVGVWVLEGSPVVISRGSARLRAPSVRYDARSQVVVATGGVAYSDPSGEIQARTLTVWLAEERVLADGDVSVLAAGPPAVEMRAARAEADRARGVVTASGDVTVRREDLILRARDVAYHQADRRVTAAGDAVVESPAGVLAADRMTALLEEDVLEADGRVRYRYRDISGTADRVRLDWRSRVAVLFGTATAQMGPHRLTAEVLTVDLAARRITAAGAARLTVVPP